MTELHHLGQADTDATGDGLTFFREHRWRLGHIVNAAVTFLEEGDDDPYRIVLRDDHGTRLSVSGDSTADVGGSRRGALQILAEAGFAPEVAAPVRAHDYVRLSRTADGTTRLEQATAVPTAVTSPFELAPVRALRWLVSALAQQQGRTR
ncbi:MAG TPA: hypothetical protein VMU66_05315 [Gaiellales bacterium]|nr:hypothetical protein [Gaiellales bacterium]